MNPIAQNVHAKLKFYSKASTCISNFQNMHWTKKALSFIQSFGTFLFYYLNKAFDSIRGAEVKMKASLKLPLGFFSAKKLIVCIHGLNNGPIQFKKIVEEIHKKQPTDTEIYIPSVLKRGNAKLDDLVKPIFEEIDKWAKTAGDKELVLVGISNGGRIAKALDAQVGCFANIKKLRLISIVGALQGSSLATLANRLHLSWVMQKDIRNEMPMDSNRSLQLDREWKDALANAPHIKREYTFIASPHDWQVPNVSSTLAIVPDDTIQTRYAIIPGHGHNSIVNAVADAVADISLLP